MFQRFIGFESKESDFDFDRKDFWDFEQPGGALRQPGTPLRQPATSLRQPGTMKKTVSSITGNSFLWFYEQLPGLLFCTREPVSPRSTSPSVDSIIWFVTLFEMVFATICNKSLTSPCDCLNS